MRRDGLDYGYHFESLGDISTSTADARCALAKVQNNWHGDEQFYHLHPVILDSYFQLLSIAARYGLTYDYHQVLPASVGSLVLRRSSADDLTVSANADLVGSGVCGTGKIVAGDMSAVELSDVRMTSFATGGEEEHASLTARSEWVPCIETEPLNTIVKPIRDGKAYAGALDELVGLSIAASQKSTAGVDVIPELQRYKAWLDATTTSLENLDDATLNTRIDAIATSLASTPVAPIVKAITMVTENTLSILSGRKRAFEILDTDDTLGKLNRFAADFDGSTFFNHLGHKKPNLRVLELGAGIGSATAAIVKDFTRPDGQTLFSQYTVSDPSPGKIDALKTRFQNSSSMTFEVLDIGVDLESQGFNEKDFDLIIAAGVLHSTPRLSGSLDRVAQLLAPSGRLLLQSLQPGLSWCHYVFGTLPSWDVGIDDGRASEPFIDVDSWKERVASTGLKIVDEPAFDAQGSGQTSHVVVASPQRSVEADTAAKKVTEVSELSAASARTHPVVEELLSRNYDISYCSLLHVPPPNQDIIALLDGQTSFLEPLDSARMEQLKTLIDRIHESGILWITKSCHSQCADPSFAQIHGLARCIRSELDVAFAVCEVDDVDSLQGRQAVAGVLQKFSSRTNDGEIEPDFEYLVDAGTTRVNRFFPVSTAGESAPPETSSDARLTIDQPGRLDTLRWRSETVDALQQDEVQVEIHAAGLNFGVSSTSITFETFKYSNGILGRSGGHGNHRAISPYVRLRGDWSRTPRRAYGKEA